MADMVFSGVTFSGGYSITLPATPAETDPYFMYNSLLLPGNGTNNAQNNTFLDSSTNNFTVIRNGNTTQGTISPYGSNWSNYFDGTGDNLLLPYSTAFNLPADFTLECWIYPTVASGMIINCGGGSNIAWASYELVWNGSAVNFAASSANSGYDIGSETGGTGTIGTPTLNQWNHIAVTRSGNTYRGFLNGVLGYTQTLALAPYNQTTRGLSIGANYTNTWGTGTPTSVVTGNISNVRIVKGTAVYTAAFTPPTSPLTSVSGTSLLTCQSNRLVDNSTNNFTIVKNGDTRVQRFSPFEPSAAYSSSTVGGSAYFDGNGDYLDVTSSSVTLSASWTIECWFQTIPISAIIFDCRPDGSNGFFPMLTGNGNTTEMNLYYNNADHVFTVGTYTQFWNHIAIVKTPGTLTVYFNGVSVYSISDSNTWSVGTNRPRLGANGGFLAGAPSYYTGYIGDFRIVNGTAVYTSAFTPPTTPLTAITNTRLLYNFTNAGIIDNSMMTNLETIGDAKISTAQSKFGGSSMLFDGTGDSLNIFNNTVGVLGTGNFTVEAWIYTTVTSGTQCVYDTRQTDGTTTGFYFGLYSTNILLFYTSGTLTLTGGSVPANTWTHIALVRVGNTFTGYINGTSIGTASNSNNFTNTVVQIGSSNNVTSSSLNYFNGYIDDLRVTKGVARYTSNFTPPTSAFQLY
jgi:hypothetical protein